MLVKWPLLPGIFTQHRVVLQPGCVPRALWAEKKDYLAQLRLMPPCVLSHWHTSFCFCPVWLSSNRRKPHNEREKSTVSDQTAKDFPHWYIGEMKVLLLLSLPGPVFIWTMWKHQCEGRVVSCNARVCIWKFHLILKTHLILEWEHGFFFVLSLWKLFLFKSAVLEKTFKMWRALAAVELL